MDYVEKVAIALQANRETWFPMNRQSRREMNLRLGHEFGYGLGADENWLGVAQSTYGKLIAKNSLDSIGVVINAREWVDAITQGVVKYEANQ